MGEKTLPITGGCLWGAERCCCLGEPLWVAHCHCASCRRASGAAFVTWAGYTNETYEVTRGTPLRFNSSPGVTRGACGRCGSPLTYEADHYPGEVHVTVGTLDDPEDFPPGGHVWTEDQLPWLRLDDHLPRRRRTGREESGV